MAGSRKWKASGAGRSDTVLMQKIANDSRLEQERMAAAELAAKNDYLANQRVSAYMRTIKLRQKDETR